MNKTESARYVEEVRGVIVGDNEPSQHVELVAPNGNVQRTDWLHSTANAKQWGAEQKARLLAQKCGNGKPLSDYPNLVESIYGKGSWEVRIRTL